MIGPQKGESEMRKWFLTITVALASMFATQQAVAKSSTKTPKAASANKKHHNKKHKKAPAASIATPTTQATARVS